MRLKAHSLCCGMTQRQYTSHLQGSIHIHHEADRSVLAVRLPSSLDPSLGSVSSVRKSPALLLINSLRFREANPMAETEPKLAQGSAPCAIHQGGVERRGTA